MWRAGLATGDGLLPLEWCDLSDFLIGYLGQALEYVLQICSGSMPCIRHFWIGV